MDEDHPLRNFTILGRLWIITCIVLGALAFVAYVTELLPTFQPGSYPIILFIIPVVLATLAVYALGYGFLRLCGFRLRKQPTNDDGRNKNGAS